MCRVSQPNRFEALAREVAEIEDEDLHQPEVSLSRLETYALVALGVMAAVPRIVLDSIRGSQNTDQRECSADRFWNE